jgi:hypothetical protein
LAKNNKEISRANGFGCLISGKPEMIPWFIEIKRYAEEAKLTPVKACMKLLDTCLKVIDAIVSESKAPELQKVA